MTEDEKLQRQINNLIALLLTQTQINEEFRLALKELREKID